MSDDMTAENDSERDDLTQWHPGCCGAIKLEFRHEKPVSLMKFLTDNGMTVNRSHDGIYRVDSHRYFPLQILVTREMSTGEHLWLSSLKRGISPADGRALLLGVEEMLERG